MPADTTPLTETAREIFADLGYTVSGAGAEFHATHPWREVIVTAVADRVDLPAGGTYRCFVTWRHNVETVERALDGADPGYEWAVIGIDADGEYEVARAPAA